MGGGGGVGVSGHREFVAVAEGGRALVQLAAGVVECAWELLGFGEG